MFLCGGEPERTAAPQRYDAVDLLRGLAVLSVILLHINLRIPFKDWAPALPKWALNDIFRNGHSGVTVFFVVSGFLITTTALRRWGSLAAIRPSGFYKIRLARIAPCLLALLVVLSILHLFGVNGFVIDTQRATLPRALFAALTLHLNWLEAQKGYLPGSWDVLWSLSVEEMFYLFFPLICFFVCKLRGKLAGWTLAGITLALVILGPFARTIFTQNELWQDKSYLGSMDSIAMGCVAALVVQQIALSRRWRWGLGLAGVAIMSLMLFVKVWVRGLGLYTAGLDATVLSLGAAAFLIAQTAAPGFGNRMLQAVTAPLRMVGRSSYEIYLTHMFAVTALFNLYNARQKNVGELPLWYLAMILSSVLLGVAVDHLYSSPLNRWLRRR